jgi:hypothetical protein
MDSPSDGKSKAHNATVVGRCRTRQSAPNLLTQRASRHGRALRMTASGGERPRNQIIDMIANYE